MSEEFETLACASGAESDAVVVGCVGEFDAPAAAVFV
jgi:hypothetical protein